MFPDPEPTQAQPQKNGIELRVQTIEYVEDSIAATGLVDGWTISALPGSRSWDPTTAWFGGQMCSTTASTPYLQFIQNVYHDPVADPGALVAKVGAHWRSLGYDVSVVNATMMNPGGEHDTHIRADLSNGALLGIEASDQIIAFNISSECSTHPSLQRITGPEG